MWRNEGRWAGKGGKRECTILVCNEGQDLAPKTAFQSGCFVLMKGFIKTAGAVIGLVALGERVTVTLITAGIKICNLYFMKLCNCDCEPLSLLPPPKKSYLGFALLSWTASSDCQRWQKRVCVRETESLRIFFIYLLFSLFGNYHIHHLLQSI